MLKEEEFDVDDDPIRSTDSLSKVKICIHGLRKGRMMSKMFPKERAGIWDPGSGNWGLGEWHGLGLGVEHIAFILTLTLLLTYF